MGFEPARQRYIASQKPNALPTELSRRPKELSGRPTTSRTHTDTHTYGGGWYRTLDHPFRSLPLGYRSTPKQKKPDCLISRLLIPVNAQIFLQVVVKWSYDVVTYVRITRNADIGRKQSQ